MEAPAFAEEVRGDTDNAFLVEIWAVAGFGYFWPGWILAGWGVFLALDVWDAYVRQDVTEEDVQRELDRTR